MPNTNNCEDCGNYDGEYCLFFKINYDAKPITPKRTDEYCDHFREVEKDGLYMDEMG